MSAEILRRVGVDGPELSHSYLTLVESWRPPLRASRKTGASFVVVPIPIAVFLTCGTFMRCR